MSEIACAVEALLFAAGAPVKVADLALALQADDAEIADALRELAARYAGGGVELSQVGAGWQLRSAPRFGTAILRLRGGKPQKLSPQALEVLAVIAYKQPVTRAEVEALRGVDSGGVLKSLLDRGVVRVAGRREEPGRPLEYATTDVFLELFGLPSLASLPTLREREELMADTHLSE